MEVVYILLVICVFARSVNSVTIDSVQIKDNVVPEKDSSIQLVCSITGFSTSTGDVLEWYRRSTSDTPVTGGLLAQCIPDRCQSYNTDYTYSVDSSHAYLTISNLSQSRDEKWWTCKFGVDRKSLQLMVFTKPKSIQYESVPSSARDLAVNKVSLECKTMCVHPAPNFTWFYIDNNNYRQPYSGSTEASEQTNKGCTDLEKDYSSTLSLERFTTFTGNEDKRVKFQCGITAFPGLTDSLYTALSPEIMFAVKVTSIILKDGDNEANNGSVLILTGGMTKTLTCSPGLSRPAATIVWYIGNTEKQRSSSTSYTFAPVDRDHVQLIYCTAFNLPPEYQAVYSAMLILFVQVPVSHVTLTHTGSTPSSSQEIHVIDGVSTTLTCTPGLSRPAAILHWYIDNVKQQYIGTTFTFIPRNEYHGKVIYCTAYNIQAADSAVSSNIMILFVNVLATTPTLSNKPTTGNRVLPAGDKATFICISSATRPTAIVTWYKGDMPLSSMATVQETNISDASGLVSVTSVLTFTPVHSDDGAIIKCETRINVQTDKPSDQQTIDVWWAPLQATIQPNMTLPWREGQTSNSLLCTTSDYGNPTSAVTWTSATGTTDANMRLIFPMLSSVYDKTEVTCELSNDYTKMKGVRIQQTITLNVQYKPIVTVIVNGSIKRNITLNEGRNLSVLCTAVGNPEPHVQWFGKSKSGGHLEVIDIDRQDERMYICRASATSVTYPSYSFLTDSTLNVAVNYPPDVEVELQTTSLENSSAHFNCNATGRPDVYEYTAIVHTWRGTVIPNTHLASTDQYISVNIPSLQLQDTGEYTCHVNNGIRDRSGKLDQTANVTLRLEVSPKILPQQVKFAGAKFGSVIISVPFYSYPTATQVIFTNKDGVHIQNNNRTTVLYQAAPIKTQFYGTDVTLDGNIAFLQIFDLQENDFTGYTLTITNRVGANMQTFVLIPTGPPNKPESLNIEEVDETHVVISWIRGFHGGYDQTFVMQISLDLMTWSNIVTFTGGQETNTNRINTTLNTLSASTLYYFRMYSYNKIGNSNFTDVLNFTTTKLTAEEASLKGSSTDAVVGGVIGGLVVIAIVVFVALMARRYQLEIICHKKQGNPDGKTSDRDGAVIREQNTATTDSESSNNAVDLSDLSAHYTTLTNRQSISNTYDSLHNTEIQEAQLPANVYENLKI